MKQEIEILLVEDSASDAEMTINALRSHNFGVKLLHVKDGVQALDFLFGEGKFTGRNTEDKPKLILLDLKMPRMDGIEVLQIVRTDERTRSIPVVMLTSSKEDPDVKKCYELGANSYVVKPVEYDEFQSAIANLGLYWMLVNHKSQ